MLLVQNEAPLHLLLGTPKLGFLFLKSVLEQYWTGCKLALALNFKQHL